MQIVEGRVIEVQLSGSEAVAAWVACPPSALPAAGQWMHAWSPADVDAPLGAALFPAELDGDAFLAAPPIPASWGPGTTLILQGPLGHGFDLPRFGNTRRSESFPQRLALIAFGESVARLLPLAWTGLRQGAAVALFAGSPLPSLPPAVEARPLEALPEALSWADFMALDLRPGTLPILRRMLHLPPGARLPCPAQALVYTEMPCAGLGACGACAVSARRGWKLTCADGPVFDLTELDW